MSYTRDHDKRPDDRWYEKDPLAKGKGLGLVLHEKSGRWTVVSVLRESPAERAGVRTGDVLVRVEDYALKGGDSLELVCLIRSGMQKERFEVVLDRKQEGEVRVPIAPKSMMRILARHGRLNGGFNEHEAICPGGTVRVCDFRDRRLLAGAASRESVSGGSSLQSRAESG